MIKVSRKRNYYYEYETDSEKQKIVKSIKDRIESYISIYSSPSSFETIIKKSPYADYYRVVQISTNKTIVSCTILYAEDEIIYLEESEDKIKFGGL